MVPTTLAGVFITLAAYAALDRHLSAVFTPLAGAASSGPPLSLSLYLPVIVLLIMVLAGANIRYAFTGSIAAAAVVALNGGVTLTELLTALWRGVEGLNGGLSGMLWLMLFIALASAYNGILEELKVIQPLTDRWMGDADSLPRRTLKTILGVLGVSLITCSQTLPIILTGRSFLPHWKKGVGLDDYARVMADSSMVMACLIPWSIHAVMCSTVLGVPVLAYLPYAWFPLALPFITLAASCIRAGRVKDRVMVTPSSAGSRSSMSRPPR
jgi:NhaC family Na+:H+ antiporter